MNHSIRKDKHNSGFTLVELIVVLVILAILAAILVPALLGYVDRAKEKQEMIKARNMLQATQTELVRLYAETGGANLEYGKPILLDVTNNNIESKNGDVYAVNTSLHDKVIETADDDPFVFMVAVGSNHNKNVSDNKTSKHDKYTVYYAFYMSEQNATPYYYYCGTWTKTNPRSSKEGVAESFTQYNQIVYGPYAGKRLQYYLIVDHTGLNDGKKIIKPFWDWCKDM